VDIVGAEDGGLDERYYKTAPTGKKWTNREYCYVERGKRKRIKGLAPNT
jgi:hypothetical protein